MNNVKVIVGGFDDGVAADEWTKLLDRRLERVRDEPFESIHTEVGDREAIRDLAHELRERPRRDRRGPRDLLRAARTRVTRDLLRVTELPRPSVPEHAHSVV